jgi:hypothetical protein
MVAAMTNPSLDSLATFACNAAAYGARDYIQARGLRPDVDFSVAALSEALKRHTKAVMDEALADAKEALDCGMSALALTTLNASFKLAGIEAAKETCSK